MQLTKALILGKYLHSTKCLATHGSLTGHLLFRETAELLTSCASFQGAQALTASNAAEVLVPSAYLSAKGE
jgi:hypothetical protein